MKLRIDLREQPVDQLDSAIAQFPEAASFMLTAWQWSAWRKSDCSREFSSRFLIMVPDFLYYARLASTGQASEIIKLPASTKRLILSGLSCVTTGISQLRGLATGQFWAAAEAMTAYDLGLLPGDFSGEVSLHYNLTDFACFFERESFLRSFPRKAGNRAWGISTQQISKAISLCTRWNLEPDRVIYTISYSRTDAQLIETVATHQFAKTRWTIDLTQWPQELFVDIDLHDFPRQTDDEWLVRLQTGIDLCNNHACFVNQITN